MVKNAHIVIGLNYGDEGKGLVTDYLSSKLEDPLVIRFNGGHQAAHTVYLESGKKHVFSSFGSGSLRGVPTYWSSYCTFAPLFFLMELESLETIPIMFVDKNCMVTTHYDVLYNRALETARGESRIGSCGVGFGATIDRNLSGGPQLSFDELLGNGIPEKLNSIRKYYQARFFDDTGFDFGQFDHDSEDVLLLDYISMIKELIRIKKLYPVEEKQMFKNSVKYKNFIFEGAQGILLDKDYGNRPFITKSSTTTRNAFEIINRQSHIDFEAEIYYVSRTYLTRHGGGTFNEVQNFKPRNFWFETNAHNEYQGRFKIGFLDLDLMKASLKNDSGFHNGKDIIKNIVLTCADHTFDGKIYAYKNGKKWLIEIDDIPSHLEVNFSKVFISYGPASSNIEAAPLHNNEKKKG